MSVKKSLVEGLLIVFSVLLALVLNKSYDNYQTSKQKVIAMNSIKNEMYRNNEVLKRWKETHALLRDRVSDLRSGKLDSLKEELKRYDFLNIGLLSGNKAFIDVLLTNTAWETAKITGMIAEFDYLTVEKLAYVYEMQELITEKSVVNIIEFYLDKDSHKIEHLDQNLTLLNIRLFELTGQEQVLENLYKDALIQLEK